MPVNNYYSNKHKVWVHRKTPNKFQGRRQEPEQLQTQEKVPEDTGTKNKRGREK